MSLPVLVELSIDGIPVDLAHAPELSRSIALAVAGDADAPETLLRAVARIRSADIDRALAYNPATPGDVLDTIALAASADDQRMPRILAQHPKALPAMLDRLAHHHSSIVRSSVARHLAAPAATLVLLAVDPDHHVREAAIRNPAAPLTVIAAALGVPPDDADDVTFAVTLAKTAKKKRRTDAAVALAGNAATPPGALDWMAHTVTTFRVLSEVALNPHTPPDTVRVIFAAIDSIPVRARIAGSPTAPSDVLAMIAEDCDTTVATLKTVASNPRTPDPSLARLTGHPDSGVATSAGRTLGLPAARSAWPAMLDDPETTVWQRTALAHRASTRPLLARLAHDPSPEVRAAAARNRKATDMLLSDLADDPDASVRAAVQDRLIAAVR